MVCFLFGFLGVCVFLVKCVGMKKAPRVESGGFLKGKLTMEVVSLCFGCWRLWGSFCAISFCVLLVFLLVV